MHASARSLKRAICCHSPTAISSIARSPRIWLKPLQRSKRRRPETSDSFISRGGVQVDCFLHFTVEARQRHPRWHPAFGGLDRRVGSYVSGEPQYRGGCHVHLAAPRSSRDHAASWRSTRRRSGLLSSLP